MVVVYYHGLVAPDVRVIFNLEGRMVSMLGDGHCEFGLVAEEIRQRNERKSRNSPGMKSQERVKRRASFEGGKVEGQCEKDGCEIRAPSPTRHS